MLACWVKNEGKENRKTNSYWYSVHLVSIPCTREITQDTLWPCKRMVYNLKT